jgi:hypothetical protein
VDLARKSPDEALKAVADAMNKVENQSDKVRLAFKLFDSEGVNLVNTLKLGSEGLSEVEREAEELGLTLNRTDAAMVEAANDAKDRLGKAFIGLASTIAVELAPSITLP